MDLVTIGLIMGGLALLTIGGELLVRGAAALAALVGVSPLVIGLTVVAFGTSAPELAVSIQAGLGGNPDIAIGNVIGSNIFNVLFVLGACALIAPLIVSAQVVRREVPIMIGVCFVMAGLVLDGRIGLIDGTLLFAMLVAYTIWSIVSSRKETEAARQEYAEAFGAEKLAPRRSAWSLLKQLALVIGGLIVLVIGSRWLVSGAVDLARALGVSDVIIGLTIVAAGTSLPEVVASLIATLKHERDIAIGNVVGSNIFNVLGILGISALVVPGGLPVAASVLNFDLPVMLAVMVACLPVFFTGMSIARWEGGLFLAYYVAYTAYLVLDATQHDALPAFSSIMGMFVVPLTAVTLGVLGVYAFIVRRRSEQAA